ncbi:MAG: 1-(5-phosphoribosyl)-5-[(5-phosphoribosylamino)methylideneamino]imidazole-4-carboxamide isomerase [Candidatus Dormibacteraeota bacterium]|nr:1-(5-phosphoribosyl)-5-[(5-phosphoribosylamino)methylideneamino]imidazole-4-carboxamide isomerase [Candidatus Dormibacteraeota bacterium]
MEVIPAIDIRGGRAVRLTEGNFQSETVYGDDPLAIAHRHRQAGATRIHVVDLDAALGRARNNRAIVSRIVAEAGVEVQVAGGVRDDATAAEWMGAGAAAIVMGTAAIRDPDLFSGAATAHPGRVMGALDLRGGTPQVSGWTASESVELLELLSAWESLPLAGIILTAVERDGTFAGPDLESLRQTIAATGHRVLYAGGIANLDDVRAVARAGASGVIIGKAIYEGRVDLAAALSAG